MVKNNIKTETTFCNCEECQSKRYLAFNRCMMCYLIPLLAEKTDIEKSKISGAVIFERHYLFTDGERMFHFDTQLDPTRIKDHPEEFPPFLWADRLDELGDLMKSLLFDEKSNFFEINDEVIVGSVGCVCSSDNFSISRKEIIKGIINDYKDIWMI